MKIGIISGNIIEDIWDDIKSQHKPMMWCNYSWHDIMSSLHHMEEIGYDVRFDGDWTDCVGGVKIDYDKFKIKVK